MLELRSAPRGKAEGVLVGGTYLATRRPATERSEGAQLGAPPEPSTADEEDPLRRTGKDAKAGSYKLSAQLWLDVPCRERVVSFSASELVATISASIGAPPRRTT